MRWVRIVLFVLRILAVVWVALVGIYSGLKILGYLPNSPELDPIAWTVSLVLIGADSLRSLIKDRVGIARTKIRAELDRAALTLVLEQLKLSGSALAFEDLGVSVWVPNGWSRATRRRGKKTKFKRLTRFRPNDFPPPSGIEWSGATGTIGTCWQSQTKKYDNVNAIAKRWGDGELTQAQFERISPATRMGFNREQFAKIAGKYSEILAVPIWHSNPEKGTLIGVLTLDRRYDPDQSSFTAQLGGQKTHQIAAVAASLASATLTAKDS